MKAIDVTVDHVVLFDSEAHTVEQIIHNNPTVWRPNGDGRDGRVCLYLRSLKTSALYFIYFEPTDEVQLAEIVI